MTGFLGHAIFYRRFIKDFLKIVKSLGNLLVKEKDFQFDDECMKSFSTIVNKLVTTLVIFAPNWQRPFEIMCNAIDYAVGAILGQHR